jgi:hypothetical protein
VFPATAAEDPVVTLAPEGTLFVVAHNDECGTDRRTASVAAFDTEGSLRWWRDLALCCASSSPRRVVPAPSDGLFVVWVHTYDDSAGLEIVRDDAEGRSLYSRLSPWGW